jgi:hypothetical protein
VASTRKTAAKGKSTGTRTKKTLSLSARPHKRTTSGRKLFEPIDMTPTERLEAGEKLPRYIANTREPWTPANIRELKSLAKANTPTRVIGLKLGRSEVSVRAKARSEGISLKPANRSPYGTKKK